MAKKETKKATTSDSKSAPKTLYGAEALENLFKPLQGVTAGLGLDKMKDQLDKFAPNMLKGYGNVGEQNKENVEAVVRSLQVLAKSAEEIGKALSAFTQSSLELNSQAGQAILGAKSLKGLVEVQQELARTSFDQLIAASAKISDLAVKGSSQAMEPIQARVTVTIEKITKAA